MRLLILTTMIVFAIQPQRGDAALITAQFSGTISTTGTPDYETDNLGLFGGGSLAGAPVIITYSINTDFLSTASSEADPYTELYQDTSSPSRIDGTVTIQLNGHTFQTSIVDSAEILASGLSYGNGGGLLDAFVLDVPGGYNVNNGNNGLEVQINSGVGSYIDGFIPNYLDPTVPAFALNSTENSLVVPFDPNEIYLSNLPGAGAFYYDALYYDVTSVDVTGDGLAPVPEPSSWILVVTTLAGIVAAGRKPSGHTTLVGGPSAAASS